MKHIEIDFHFAHDKVQEGQLYASNVNSNDQLTNALTKPLSQQRLQDLCIKISVLYENSILRGHNKENQSNT